MISLVLTMLNEVASLDPLLESIAQQSHPPDEVVICDAGSSDGTVARLRARQLPPPTQVRVIVRPGANIAQGRNAAIQEAAGEVIAVTDGGCILDPEWLERISRPLRADTSISVVYGATLARGRSRVGCLFAAFYA
ncbi:MAG: glycosyltransferase family A protein, partial [Solirubrobacteraceae bacterium]